MIMMPVMRMYKTQYDGLNIETVLKLSTMSRPTMLDSAY